MANTQLEVLFGAWFFEIIFFILYSIKINMHVAHAIHIVAYTMQCNKICFISIHTIG